MGMNLCCRGPNTKVIFTMRNLKDCAVSGFKHFQSLGKLDITWEKFFHRFIHGGPGEIYDTSLTNYMLRNRDLLRVVGVRQMESSRSEADGE